MFQLGFIGRTRSRKLFIIIYQSLTLERKLKTTENWNSNMLTWLEFKVIEEPAVIKKKNVYKKMPQGPNRRNKKFSIQIQSKSVIYLLLISALSWRKYLFTSLWLWIIKKKWNWLVAVCRRDCNMVPWHE